MSDIILSIVIPTKNRYYTLFNLIDKLLTWESHEFEVVVQDNTEDNKPAVEHFSRYRNDARLVYAYEASPLVPIDNYTRAFKKARGTYICFLGDDDGIIFQSIAFAKWMKRESVDSANFDLALFNWEGLEMKYYGKKLAGTLTISGQSGKLRFLDPIEVLRQVLRKGAQEIGELPRTYHGIVSKRCLEALYETHGTYFPGPVADMANAVANCFFVKRHVLLDYPLVLAGASPRSMAGRSALQKAHSEIEKEKSLPPGTADTWSSILPRYWANQTIWPEGAIKALINTGHADFVQYLNLNMIYAALLMYTSGIRGRIIRHMISVTPAWKMPGLFFKVGGCFLVILASRLRTLTKSLLFMLGLSPRVVGYELIPASTIGEAIDKLEEKTYGRKGFAWNR